jgi:dephospho-CoA kinase
MSRDILIVALTGMPGAGKTTVANNLHHMGIPLLIMGDVIREAAESQGLSPTSDNLANLMIKLRKKNGPGAVAHLIANKINLMRKEDNKLNVVIVDGIRSMAEVEVLKDMGNVKLLAIHGSTFTRYTHVKERKRSDVPSNIDEFDKRDKTEMEVGISNAIALADETVSNNDITISQLCEQSFTTVKKWMQESGIRSK